MKRVEISDVFCLENKKIKSESKSSTNILQLDDYSILDIAVRMDWRTRKAFALTCKRFHSLLPSLIGSLVVRRYPGDRYGVLHNFKINGHDLERAHPANRFYTFQYEYVVSENLTELTLCGLRFQKEDCEYNVSFKCLKVLYLSHCEVNKFNYFWNACNSTLEKLTIIKEEFDYRFKNLIELICDYPLRNIQFSNEKRSRRKSTFLEFIERNPSILKLETSWASMDYWLLYAIHNSNIVNFKHKFGIGLDKPDRFYYDERIAQLKE